MELLEQIFASGSVGAGGAGFPTHKKLAEGTRLLLVNAAECEPLLCSDRYVMRNFAAEIIEALIAVKDRFKIPRVVIGTKEKYTREIAALKKEIDARNSDIEIFTVSSFYPAGDEQALIYEVIKEAVPPGGIPPMLGVAVINITTALFIRRAMLGVPVTRRYVTVNGAVNNPVIVDAPVGAKFSDIIKMAGGATADSYTIIKGGPMMGAQFPMRDAEHLTIGKADGGMIILPESHPLVQFSKQPLKQMLSKAKSVCIQCSYCTEMCPRYLIGHRLRPNRVMRSMATGTNESDLADALLCCECGLCELFACPMQLSPRKVNIHVKGILRERGINSGDKTLYERQSEPREYRRLSQSRLISRLGLNGYPTEVDGVVVLEPDEVCIPLKHGVGKPSAPLVKLGDRVEVGTPIAGVEFADVGCMIHASIAGTVTSIDNGEITIKRGGDAQ